MSNIKKSCLLFFIVFLLTGGQTVLANLNEALTIWGARVEVIGSEADWELEKHIVAQLKGYGLSTKTNSPFMVYRFNVNQTEVRLNIVSSRANSLLFKKSVLLNSYSAEAAKGALNELLSLFHNKLPFKGLIYFIDGDEVKVNIGKNFDLNTGDTLKVIRFKGPAPAEINLDEEFSFKTVGKIRIFQVKNNFSLGKIVKDNGIQRFDKVIIADPDFKEPAAGKTNKGKNKKFGFLIGVNSESLKVKPTEDLSSYPIVPDVDKKLTFISLVPQLGMEYWISDRFESIIDFQYRKIPLTLQSGAKIKATFMRFDFDVKYWIKPKGEDFENAYALILGYWLYYNTINEEIIRYISTKYSGPQLGFEWKNFYKRGDTFLKFKLYPYLFVGEDKVKRGSKASAAGYYLNFGYIHKLSNVVNIQGGLFYRRIHTSFSGDTSHDISPKDLHYIESEIGSNIKFIFYF